MENEYDGMDKYSMTMEERLALWRARKARVNKQKEHQPGLVTPSARSVDGQADRQSISKKRGFTFRDITNITPVASINKNVEPVSDESNRVKRSKTQVVEKPVTVNADTQTQTLQTIAIETQTESTEYSDMAVQTCFDSPKMVSSSTQTDEDVTRLCDTNKNHSTTAECEMPALQFAFEVFEQKMKETKREKEIAIQSLEQTFQQEIVQVTGSLHQGLTQSVMKIKELEKEISRLKSEESKESS